MVLGISLLILKARSNGARSAPDPLVLTEWTPGRNFVTVNYQAMRKEVVLDLETKNAPRGWSDREELKNLGVSVVGIWSSEDDGFKTFRESEFKSLEALLKNADRIVGFAVKKFDIPVLQPHVSFDLAEVPVLDMFEDISSVLGHRISRASLAKATLGAVKSGRGLDAIDWYREGNWVKLEEYCLQDVRITRDLYRYGKKFGHLLFESLIDGKVVSVPVSWGMPNEAEIRTLVERAQNEKKAMEIDYVSRENAGEGFLKTRRIEIQDVKGDEIEAYDHLRGDVRSFRLGRIFGARVLNEPVKPRPVAQSLFS